MAGRRNAVGVNDSADLIRTIKGELYPQYGFSPKPDQLATYRKQRVRFRIVKIDGEPNIFVRKLDWPLASQLDARYGW